MVRPTDGKKADATALNFKVKKREDSLSRHEAFVNTHPCGFIMCF